MLTEHDPMSDLLILPDGNFFCRSCDSNGCDHMANFSRPEVGAAALARFVESYPNEQMVTADIHIPTDLCGDLIIRFFRTDINNIWDCVMVAPTHEIPLTTFAVGLDSFQQIEDAIMQVEFVYEQSNLKCPDKKHFSRSKYTVLETEVDVLSFMKTGKCAACEKVEATSFDHLVVGADASMPSVWGAKPPMTSSIGSAVGASLEKSMKEFNFTKRVD